MTLPTYLTARCNRGCEQWGTPDAISQHVRERRCRGVAWFRRPVRTVLIQAEYVQLLRDTVAEHLVTPNADAKRETGRPHAYQPHAVLAGGQLRSPIEGVPPRVWWLAVKPYLDADIPPDDVLDLAVDADSFYNLMSERHLDQFTACPECGELLVKLEAHQRTSSRCRTAAAANRVLELWAKGYRDPWTAMDRPPLAWGELQVARWKHRLAVVEFPKVNAVLMAPPPAGGRASRSVSAISRPRT